MLRFISILLAFYLIYMGGTSLLLIYQNISGPADPSTQLLRYVGAIIPSLLSILYFAGAYALFKNQHDKFPAYLGFFVAQLLIVLAIIFSGVSGRLLVQFNPIFTTIVFGIPILLFVPLILSARNRPKTNSLQSARNTLGEHIEHLSDEELKESLKH